jgi:acetoin utilization deacetylase AcuC-like enzyme
MNNDQPSANEMTTAIIHHPIYREHDTGAQHPETPARYDAIMRALRGDEKLWAGLKEIEATSIAKGTVQSCHTPQHFKEVESAVQEGKMFLDADTIVSARSLDAALYAAGGVCRGVDAVMSGEVQNAFAATRPPGHHATRETSMGFCLFNNVAIGARYAQQKFPSVEKVAIIDWDVHHGNGTQGIFYDDPTVFFFSMHQYPWYPGTGSAGETGRGRGLGFTLNAPVRAKTPAREQRKIFLVSLEEISSKFKPDLIMISAGFDAHASDPLGQLLLEDEDFSEMTKIVKHWAVESCGGKIVAALEGGYNLKTLGETVRSFVAELTK